MGLPKNEIIKQQNKKKHQQDCVEQLGLMELVHDRSFHILYVNFLLIMIISYIQLKKKKKKKKKTARVTRELVLVFKMVSNGFHQ